MIYVLQVLDLSFNDLKGFNIFLPVLKELHLSGNKLLRLPAGQLFPNLQILTIQVRNNQVFLFPVCSVTNHNICCVFSQTP